VLISTAVTTVKASEGPVTATITGSKQAASCSPSLAVTRERERGGSSTEDLQ